MRLVVLVLFVLILMETARAQDLSPPNSAGNLVAQSLSLFDANPIGAAPEQNSLVPDTPALPSVTAPQHFSVASSADATRLVIGPSIWTPRLRPSAVLTTVAFVSVRPGTRTGIDL